VARLSLLLLPVLFVGLLLVAPAAQALPSVPQLYGTTPVSPNTSLTPLVYGSSEGTIKSSPVGLFGPVRNTGSSPTNVIKLFTDAACKGSMAAQGTAAQLDGAGIQVSVLADTTTTFYAEQFDKSGGSGCSGPLSYQHMTNLPAPPVEPPPGGGAGSPGVGGGVAALIMAHVRGISTAAWTADFPDPVTFLGMFTANSAYNWTGWNHPGYEKLMDTAATTANGPTMSSRRRRTTRSVWR